MQLFSLLLILTQKTDCDGGRCFLLVHKGQKLKSYCGNERKARLRETDFSAKIRCLFKRDLVLLFGLFRDLIKYLPD